VQGTSAKDEVGAMARAVEVFRENAIAKSKTEDELRASKEKAESALLELNTAQQNLIDAFRQIPGLLDRRVGGLASSFQIVVPDCVIIGAVAVLDRKLAPRSVHIKNGSDFIQHCHADRVGVDQRPQVQFRDLFAAFARRCTCRRREIRGSMFKAFGHWGKNFLQ